jgi:hypothetical protein
MVVYYILFTFHGYSNCDIIIFKTPLLHKLIYIKQILHSNFILQYQRLIPHFHFHDFEYSKNYFSFMTYAQITCLYILPCRYFKKCEGSWTNGEWIVFWYGVPSHRMSNILTDYALTLDDSFATTGNCVYFYCYIRLHSRSTGRFFNIEIFLCHFNMH